MSAELNAWLPSFDVRELHRRFVACPPRDALELALRLPVASDRVVSTLFRLRGYRASGDPIGEFFAKDGFVALERTPTRFVFGIAARIRGEPRHAADRDGWLAWRAPGIKIVADIDAAPHGDGTMLTTETRVLALDRRSRILFRLYWLVVRPFSALIRRRWLDAIAARAADRA